MIITILLTVITGLLMGFYGYKTIASKGNKIGGVPMLIMKASPFMFFATLVIGFINISWKVIFVLPLLYLIAIPTKNILLYIARKDGATNE